jgi:hypothetical protein
MQFQQLIYQTYATDNIDFKKYVELYNDWFVDKYGELVVANTIYYYDKIENRDTILANGLIPHISDEFLEFFDVGKSGSFVNMQLNPVNFLYQSPEEFKKLQFGLDVYEVESSGYKFYPNPCYFSVEYLVTFETISKDKIKLL